ncbi:MAG: hypothetical protein QOI10_2242, partial [Solirubrobacterales bacterium]|nr:hypothetical protein [Solirubrobacterales bacterium]
MSLVATRYGSWRWMVAAALAAILSLSSILVLGSARDAAFGSASASASSSSSPLAELAAAHPAKHVEVIVQLRAGIDPARADQLAASAGGVVEQRLELINGFSTT